MSKDDTTHEETPDIAQQQSRSRPGIQKPNPSYIVLIETYKDTMQPANAKEALTRPLWKQEMQQ